MDITGEDARLVESARRGDVAAFNRLVIAYQQLAFNVALRLVGDPETAADATQDAFLSAYRALRDYRGGSFRAWLLRIVTNASYDYLRVRQRRPTSSLDALRESEEAPLDPPDPEPGPEQEALRAELRAELAKLLLDIPFDQRVAVVLYDVNGLSYEEVSATTGVSLGTVKSRISRGRGRLRELLAASRELSATGSRLHDKQQNPSDV